MPLVAMFVSNRGPLAHPPQVFAGACLARYDGLLHPGRADTGMHVFWQATLPARVLAQAALGMLRVDRLQALAAQMVTRAHGVDQGAAERLPRTVGGQIDEAQVHTQRPAIRLGLRRRCAALGDVQGRGARTPDQSGPAHFPRRVYPQLVLTRPHEPPADDAPSERLQGDTIQAHQSRGPRIVADTPTRAKRRAGRTLLCARGLERRTRLRPGTDGHLRAQPVGQAGLPLDPMGRRVGVGDALIPTHARTPGSRFVEGALRRGQCQVVAVTIERATDGARERVVQKKRVAQVLNTCQA